MNTSGFLALGTLMAPHLLSAFPVSKVKLKKVPVNAHLWVYASKFPPHWDATPILETIFSDLSYAGIEGLELMEAQLRHHDSVERINGLSENCG